MKAIKQKIATNLAFTHYIAYCLSFLGYGCVITGLGPLIPYLAQLTGNPQTQYSFLFFCRSTGFITGAIILRYLQKKMTFHQIIIMSSIILVFILGTFSFVINMNIQGTVLFFISMCCCFLEVMVNVCVLETQKNGNIQFWMLICHGVFGIGGLIGPILVYIFEIYSFLVMGFLIVAVTPFYIKLKTPEDHMKVQQQVTKQSILQELNKSGYQGQFGMTLIKPKQQQKIARKPINKQIQYLVCFLFLIYIGLECGFGSWISSYAVLQEISTKQEATRYSSIFWVSMTIFRFLSSCMPYSSMKKLFLLGYSMIVYVLITLFLIFIDMKELACYFSSITYGMCFSSMFPLLLAIPTQYNLQVTAGQNANFMVWAAVGQGLLSMVIGYLMAWFSYDMLFIMLFLMGAAFLIGTYFLKDLYEKQNQSSSTKNGFQLQQINKNQINKS